MPILIIIAIFVIAFIAYVIVQSVIEERQARAERQAIDSAIIRLGYLWIDWQNEPFPTSPHARRWLRACGDRGQREENLYALMDRDIPKKRFAILREWTLFLWYDTLRYGFPPDRDGDGVEFFKYDVKRYARITVWIYDDMTFRHDMSNKYLLRYADESFNTFPLGRDEMEFQALGDLLQAIKNLEQYIVNVKFD